MLMMILFIPEVPKGTFFFLWLLLLNSNDELLPNLWCIIENQEESKNDLSLAKIKCNENTSKKIEGITFKLDEKSNYIIANKTYSSPIDAYTDFLNIRQFIFSKLNKEEKLRDSFGTSSMTYGNHKSFKDNVLSFTTSREKAREAIGDKVKKQVEAGGWIMVDNPKDADKTLTFSLSRGFSGAELEKLKKEKKDVKRDVYISIDEKREHSFSVRSIHDLYNERIFHTSPFVLLLIGFQLTSFQQNYYDHYYYLMP